MNKASGTVILHKVKEAVSISGMTSTTSYGISASNTVKPTSWSTTLPNTKVYRGQYLWTRLTIVTSYTDGTSSSNVSYSCVAIPMDGVSVRNRGEWVKSTVVKYLYNAEFRDYVYYDGAYYIRENVNKVVYGVKTPNVDTTNWSVMKEEPYMVINTLLSAEGALGGFTYNDMVFASQKRDGNNQPILSINSQTGELKCGDIHATNGIFEGLLYRAITSISNQSNKDNGYIVGLFALDGSGRYSDNQFMFDWNKMRSRIKLLPDFRLYNLAGEEVRDVELVLPSYSADHDDEHNYDGEIVDWFASANDDGVVADSTVIAYLRYWRELARSLVGNTIAIYNYSPVTINVYAYFNGARVFMPITQGRGCLFSCGSVLEQKNNDVVEAVMWTIIDGGQSNRGFALDM